MRNYRKEGKWVKGAVVSRIGTVIYEVKYDNYILYKQIGKL